MDIDELSKELGKVFLFQGEERTYSELLEIANEYNNFVYGNPVKFLQKELDCNIKFLRLPDGFSSKLTKNSKP